MTVEASTPRVVTDHGDANEAIDTLRSIAVVLKEVGDENVKLEKDNADLLEALQDAEAEARRAAVLGERLLSLREAVIDLDRGLIDQAELVRMAREEHDD